MRVRIHYNSRRIAEEFGLKAKGYVNLELPDLPPNPSGKLISKVVHLEIKERWPWMNGAVQNIERLER